MLISYIHKKYKYIYKKAHTHIYIFSNTILYHLITSIYIYIFFKSYYKKQTIHNIYTHLCIYKNIIILSEIKRETYNKK